MAAATRGLTLNDANACGTGMVSRSRSTDWGEPTGCSPASYVKVLPALIRVTPTLTALPCADRPAGLKYTPEASSQGEATPAPTRPDMQALCWSTLEPCAWSGAPTAAHATTAQAIARLRLIASLLGC